MASARAATNAEMESLPHKRAMAAAAQRGGAGSYVLDGKHFSYDFTGAGDADFQRTSDAILRESSFTNARTALDLQGKFGSEYVAASRKQLQESDPIGFALRESMGQRVSEQLSMGGSSTDAQRRLVSQGVRASQTRSGNTGGVAAGVSEVMAQGEYSRGLEQSRLSNAGAFLAGATPQAEFGQLRNAQQGAAPMAPGQFDRSIVPGFNPNNTGQALQFASNNYSTQMSGYNAQLSAQAQKGNPWMQGLGMVLGAGVSLATAGMGAGLFGAAGAIPGLAAAPKGGWTPYGGLPTA